MVPEITTGDHSERSDRGQRPRLGATQHVLAIAVPHQLALQAARQVQVMREHLAWIGIARPFVPFTLWPARIVASITAVLCGMRFARVCRPAPEVPRLIISVPRESRGPAPLVVSFVVAIRAASPAVARRSTVFVA